MVSQKKFGQAAAYFHLILRWDPKPHFIDQILENCQTVHHHIVIPSAGQKIQAQSPGSYLLSKVIKKLLYFTFSFIGRTIVEKFCHQTFQCPEGGFF
jgi:hypothetical protein